MNILHPLIYSLKLISSSPSEFYREIISDLKKDYNSINFQKHNRFVWIAGLPKSGTTLLEKILNSLHYVQLDKSPLRIFNNKELNHPHGISEKMFQCVPQNKFTFLKTHTHYTEEYLNIAKKYDAKIIISLRDLRDMMISNYLYMLNNEYSWGHDKIVDLPKKEGFMKSLTMYNAKYSSEEAIVYYYHWLKDWIKISSEYNYLNLWYENYSSNPIEYITSILKYLNLTQYKAANIEAVLSVDRKSIFENNIKKPGREISTFNKGEIGAHRDFFDDEIDNYFCSLLPGSLDEISYKG